MWDAGQYLKYADERSRPFFDLLARVRNERAELSADLGCGPGHLTRALVERWPDSRVIGVDSSQDMLRQATPIPGRLDFVLADIAHWQPEKPLDVIVSNAALQWVGAHDVLLPRLVQILAPGGTLAVQIPVLANNPAHVAIEQTQLDPRWRDRLQGVGLQHDAVQPLTWYVERLHDLGCSVDAWQTSYIHVLTGDHPVLEWYKGTALRPLLQRLDEQAQPDFLRELAARFQIAYPARVGVTLLPFPRLFFVATRP